MNLLLKQKSRMKKKKFLSVAVVQTKQQEIEEYKRIRCERALEATKSISTINRQLAMTGIALAWMFRCDSPLGSPLKTELLMAIGIFITAIVIDWIYYGVSAYYYNLYGEKKLKTWKKTSSGTIEEVINTIPPRLYVITDIIWYTRIILVIIGYLTIILNILEVDVHLKI